MANEVKRDPMGWTLNGIERLFDDPKALEEALRSFGMREGAGSSVSASVSIAPDPTQATLALERRRLRMKAAGALFPAAVEAAMASVGRPPVVEMGNDSTSALAQAVGSFMSAPAQLSLVLSAPAGRGKSWLATWAVAETTQRSVWLPAADVRVGEAWEGLRVKALRASGLLVVDDLGEEASGDWGVREMASLLEGRHNAGRRTIVTTNLMPAAIGARYGERLLSRWSQEGVSKIVCVRGVDLRRGT